jgi:hypothetical protein
MRRRAAISVLIFVAGLGSVMGGTIDVSRRNQRFQPGSTTRFAVIQPRAVSVSASTVRRPPASVQKITPILQAPAKAEIGRTALQQPRDATVQPPAVKAAGSH